MNLRSLSALFAALLSTSVLTLGPPGAAAQSGVGLELRKAANAADLGLPLYPRAVLRGDPSDDSPAVTLGAWAGSFGFHLAVSKFASDDSLPQIAAFYRQALAQHGAVVECAATEGGRPTTSAAAPASRKGGDEPGCDRDRPSRAGSVVIKAGTSRDFRLVHIEPAPRGTSFHLVRVRAGS
jgi:hypothetical protein